jgi:hypothetical protein
MEAQVRSLPAALSMGGVSLLVEREKAKTGPFKSDGDGGQRVCPHGTDK